MSNCSDVLGVAFILESCSGVIIAFFILFFGTPILIIIVKKLDENKATRLALEQAEEAEQQAELRRAEADRERDAEQQKQLKNQILFMNEESTRALEAMPVYLEAAEQHLDEAATAFAKGFFRPFWTSVERAAMSLAKFDEEVATIAKNTSAYVDLARKYRGKAPMFSVSPSSAPRLKIAFETAKRMDEIVAKTYDSRDFTLIYLQIENNQILVAGFKNLAQALEQMTWRITSSIDTLTCSVDQMSSTLNQSLLGIYEQTERVAVNTAAFREDLAKEAAGSRNRENKALEMLDNIQRKRYPSILNGGLR